MQNDFDSRQIKIRFALAGAALLVLFLLTLYPDKDWALTVEEGGAIESATALGYFLCLALIAYRGRLPYIKRYHSLVLLFIFFMLRELDFDKRFTTTGIFKGKFLLGHHVPLVEKLIGGMVILLALYTVASLIYRHARAFLEGLKNHSPISLGVLIAMVFLVVSQSLDGLDRKLRNLGVEIGGDTSMYASAAEEILELGIPIIVFLTLISYFDRVRVGR